MEVKYYLRRKMNEHNLTPKQTAELSGVGIRFVYEMLAGKPTLRMDKVNDVLRIFDAELGYEYLPEVLKQMRQEELEGHFYRDAIPDQEEDSDIFDSEEENEQNEDEDSAPDNKSDDER
ncbi:hypothetical protein SDC9_146917 [bioreactor metagenome]|uniref:HTH cro/C1-type domain-containing protein n=1 Tax=bioreactor metagenome TaxID=1076179 RepID=A0A645EG41_9ZZZZ